MRNLHFRCRSEVLDSMSTRGTLDPLKLLPFQGVQSAASQGAAGSDGYLGGGVLKNRALFRQADVTRALRAARDAGLIISSYEIDPVTGKIVVITGAGEPERQIGALDRWIANHRAS